MREIDPSYQNNTFSHTMSIKEARVRQQVAKELGPEITFLVDVNYQSDIVKIDKNTVVGVTHCENPELLRENASRVNQALYNIPSKKS
jgi:hypothetical protein